MSEPTPISTRQTQPGAYEIKFLVPSAQADEILAAVRPHLPADPYATDADGYTVHSLYFDTPNWQVFHRIGKHARRKFRLRRYGNSPMLFAERKSKSKGIVRKRRTELTDEEIARLTGDQASDDWNSFWFHRRLLLAQLRPTLQLRYHRTARMAETPQGTVRLTVDRDLLSRPADGYCFPNQFAGRSILNDQCILELKFRVAMPNLFKELMLTHRLVPQSVSKYRLSIAAWNLQSQLYNPLTSAATNSIRNDAGSTSQVLSFARGA